MGNCSSCTFCTDTDNDSLNNSLRVSTNSYLGQYIKETPSDTLCCCNNKHKENIHLLDNIKLSPKEKKLFEKKISMNSTQGIIRKTDGLLSPQRSNYNYRNPSEKLDISDISLSISNKLIINEIDQSPEKKYKIVQNLGNGSYGDVFLAYNIYTKEKVAIKKIYKSNEAALSDGEILDEVKILKSLDHPDIVKIIEFYNTEEAYYIVNEYCSGGELFEKAEKGMSETQISVVFKQILSGLSYLHSKNIVHRDLKLENILISDKEYVEMTGEEYFDIKIIDFGNAIIFDKNKTSNSIVGSSYYIAPEVFKRKYNRECDLWSAGVILYMLIVGCPPFDGNSDKKIASIIKTGIFDKDNPRWNDASSEVRDLISKLLVYDPEKRITANQALQHPWFKKTNSDILYYNISKQEILLCIQNILSYNIKSKFEELVLAYIIHNIPRQRDIRIAIKLFKLVNTHGDGRLQKEELKKTLLNFVSEEYLKNYDEIFKLLDGDNNGIIEYEEFLRAALDKKKILTENNLKLSFRFFDKENNGFITKSQMKTFFEESNINDTLCQNIFDEVDLNKDGKIDFQEFKNMMLYE